MDIIDLKLERNVLGDYHEGQFIEPNPPLAVILRNEKLAVALRSEKTERSECARALEYEALHYNSIDESLLTALNRIIKTQERRLISLQKKLLWVKKPIN